MFRVFFSGAQRARERSPIPKKMWQSTYPRNFGNLVTVRPPVRPQQRYTNVTRMVTQMQLEVILGKIA